MSASTALLLYPSWALAVLLATTAARVGRSTGRGLVALCLLLALWITALILLEHPATSSLAEHIIPSGMLLAGGFVQSGAEIIGRRLRAAVRASYAWGGGVALLGALAPHLLYAPGLSAPGPWFWPMAAASAIGAAVVIGWMARSAASHRGATRGRMILLSAGNLIGLASGGGAVLLRVCGVVPELRWTAPLLLLAVLLIGGAVLRGEHGRTRRIVWQALVYAVLTAALSAVVLAALYLWLPELMPGHGGSAGLTWLWVVLFFAVMPLDGVRSLIVEGVGRRLFRDPIGVRDLADEAARSEVRADHAERLAELGAITSAVAHEIRNPLGVIAAHAKLLERAGAPAASVAALRAQVERARRFLEDLLRYGRPRPLEVREVEVRPIVETAVESVREAMGGMDAASVEVPAELRLEADRAALTDVLIALLHNAAIAVEGAVADGGDPERAPIRVRARADGDAVAIEVEDDGPGVPAELEATLFAPFVTGRGRDHHHPGTGLGLAIVRRVVERHGGTIEHERPAAGGARFVVRWPRGGSRGST